MKWLLLLASLSIGALWFFTGKLPDVTLGPVILHGSAILIPIWLGWVVFDAVVYFRHYDERKKDE